MAKKPSLNLTLLAAIVNATQTGAVYYVTADEANPFLTNNPPLIEVNSAMSDPNDENKRAARSTEAGQQLVAKKGKTVKHTAEVPANGFEIITGAALPPSKRGGRGGAPMKYPFDKLEVGQSFFVAATAELPDPVKTLGSTVSGANNRYAKETGEMITKERTKRGTGNKAIINSDGSKVKETVTVPQKEFTRHFTIRKVESGKSYGNWTAPADGALIARDK